MALCKDKQLRSVLCSSLYAPLALLYKIQAIGRIVDHNAYAADRPSLD